MKRKECPLCISEPAKVFFLKRLGQGAMLNVIAREMNYEPRRREWGLTNRKLTDDDLAEHQRIHEGDLPAIYGGAPSFGGSEVSLSGRTSENDVATAIQEQALEMLASGQMKLSATNALRAQAMLDERVDRHANRELAVALARILSGAMPPPELIDQDSSADIIEGSFQEVEAAV
jgi:hypothetical protein